MTKRSAPRYIGLDPHYEQLKLLDMPSHKRGGATLCPIIGLKGPTDDHVPGARLCAIVVPAGSQTTVEMPAAAEDLHLYLVKGRGTLSGGGLIEEAGAYDLLIAAPGSPETTISSSGGELTFLSFYLPSFVPTTASQH